MNDQVWDTRTRLLAAAETIIVENGITGLSVRKVGDRAGLNPTLVTYHFKGIARLLDELVQRNMQPIMQGWEAVEPGLSLDEALEAWLKPMLLPAAFTPGGRALVVLDEIGAHGDEEQRLSVLGPMEQFSIRLRQVFAPHCPHLDDVELRARVRFISGGVLGPPPRSHGAPVLGEAGRALDDLDLLMRFSRAALTG